jgi:hypothetical protein
MSQNISIAFEGVPFSGKTTALKKLHNSGYLGNNRYVPETIVEILNNESVYLNDYYKHYAAQCALQKGIDCFIDRSPLSTWIIDNILSRKLFCMDFLSSIDAIIVFVDFHRRYQLSKSHLFSDRLSPWMKDENKSTISSLYEKIVEEGFFQHVPVYTFISCNLEDEDMIRLMQLISLIRSNIND